MKVIVPTLAFSLCILVLMLFFGQILLIAPLEKEIAAFQETAKRFQDEQRSLEARLSKVKPLRPDEAGKPEIHLLKPGEEDIALQKTFAEASASGIIISTFSMAKSVSVKATEPGNAKAAAPVVAAIANGILPQLDANGMPIGAGESDEPEDQTVNLLPMQISLKGTYKSLGKFFHELKKKVPLFVLRKMHLSLDGSGLGKGSVELIFPYGKSIEPLNESSVSDPNETGGK